MKRKSNRNTLLLTVIFLSLLLVFFAFSAAASSVPTVELDDVEGSILDEKIVVPVTIQDGLPMAGGEFVLTYDPDIVAPLALEKGEILEAMEVQVGSQDNPVLLMWNEDYTSDSIKVIWASGISVDEAGAPADGVLFYIEFAPVDEGYTDLLLDDFLLSDADETGPQEIPATFIDGSITVIDDVPDIVYGDVNFDGVINVEDVILIMQSILGLTQLDADQQLAADVNGDGVINVEDVILVMQYILGLITEFPVEG